jgi:alpha-tubulin suppressor-like RCC1 family protein
VVSNIPIGSISGIFYSRADLFLPPDDEMTISLMRTGTSLIENQNDNLSSKSNLSDSASNSVAETVRVKRKARRKVSDFVSLAESRAMRNGVYQWGKGVSSIPLLYPLAKNLDVFKIACGNYHVVIASAVGVYGWGENSAGQLGDPNTRESIKTIKLVLERRATCASEVDVACGNEHTAILFKEKPLVMLGQREGGIISGNGHSFEAVSCGGLHTLGLRKGRVSSWGRGEGGQLGHRP